METAVIEDLPVILLFDNVLTECGEYLTEHPVPMPVILSIEYDYLLLMLVNIIIFLLYLAVPKKWVSEIQKRDILVFADWMCL
jgi:hypothetical protein